jgi:glycosyltransferase involved in cell wall biosynthesis
MRALWLIRRSLQEQLGGDTIQVLRTAEALRSLGVEITMAPTPGPDAESYDVVHLFHLDRVWENLHHCRALAARRIPTVLTPIFWVSDDYDRRGRPLPQRMLARGLGGGALRNVRLAYQWASQLRRTPGAVGETRPVLGFERGAREILQSVDLVLPASHAEQRRLEQLFHRQLPASIVPGAADGRTFHPGGSGPDGQRSGVLCVGRIEPRKNQLALIRALRDTGIPLTLVGKAGPTSAAYERQCRREAAGHMRFLSDLEAPSMAAEYRRARVHASVSWYETPGLANLEAALCGCALVATHGGCTDEYLGTHARYCQPDDVASILRAILGALEDGPSETLRQRVRTRFTWEQAAHRTLEAYAEVARAPVTRTPALASPSSHRHHTQGPRSDPRQADLVR